MTTEQRRKDDERFIHFWECLIAVVRETAEQGMVAEEAPPYPPRIPGKSTNLVLEAIATYSQ